MIQTQNVRAALYARFSSDNQREESIDAQLRAMHNYCEDRNITVVREYCDHAKSGTSDKRPEFLRMIDDSKNGEFDIVIVHKFDRFSRNRYDSIFYKRQLNINNVSVISVLENIDDSPESALLLSVIEGYNEFYSLNLSREVMKGMRENAYKCLWTGGIAPLGYDVVDKKLAINEEEAKIVRLIFEMSAAGNGYNVIIRELNALGYKTKKGQNFGKNSLYEILRNERYKGTYVFNKRTSANANKKRNNHAYKDNSEIIRIEGGCPAIVSEELWNTVNAIRKTVNSKSNSSRKVYLLSGLVYCKCGAKFHGNVKRYNGRNKVYYSYRCSNRTRTLSCDCKEIRCEVLDAWVIDEFIKYFFNENSIKTIAENINQKLLRDSRIEESYQDAVRNHKTLEILTNNLVEAIAKAGANDALMNQLHEYESMIKDNEHLIEKYESRMNTNMVDEKTVSEHIEALRRYMKNPKNLPTTRYILSQYIERVEVSNEEVTATFRVAAPLAHGNPSDKTECSYLETVAVKHSDLFIRYSEIIKDDRICEIINRLSTNEQENSKKLHRNIENPTNSLDKSYNSNYPTDFVWDNFCISDITANKKSHPCKYKGGRSGGAEP